MVLARFRFGLQQPKSDKFMILKKLLLLLLATAGLIFTPSAKAITVIGTGDDVSYAVIQAPAFGSPLIFEYHYTYDPFNPFDGYALFYFIDDAVSNLTLDWINYGDLDDPNWFLDSITYGSTTLINTPWPDVGPYWTQWVAGGESGYPFAEPISEGVWAYGAGFSSPYRIIQPGSWDGTIYNDGILPPVSPVPEPSSTLLLIAGILLLSRHVRQLWKKEDSV